MAVEPKYLKDPEKYCRRITSLIEGKSEEWKIIWLAAIPELCNLTCELPPEAFDALFEPINIAFQSQDCNLRVEAFECWSKLIAQVPEISVSRPETLWDKLAGPFVFQDPSVYIVLDAKLKAWDIFIDIAFQSYPDALKSIAPSLLKCLYGPTPSTMEPACKFSALYETCGKLYHKIMEKCSAFPVEITMILSFLDKAIPPLSNSQDSKKLANAIWRQALNIMSEYKWPVAQFNYLLRTFDNLFANDKNDRYQLLEYLFTSLDNHKSLPPDRVTPYMNILLQCLFSSPVKETATREIMDRMLKLCENPLLFFNEVYRVLLDRISDDRDDIEMLWLVVASCYTKWVKNESITRSNDQCQNEYWKMDTAMAILLFPIEHFNMNIGADWFDKVVAQWVSCVEPCIKSDPEIFTKLLFNKIEASIGGGRIFQAFAAIEFCYQILRGFDFKESFLHNMEKVLIKIGKYITNITDLNHPTIEGFVKQYTIVIKAFHELAEHQTGLSEVIKNCSSLLWKHTNKENLKADNPIDAAGSEAKNASIIVHAPSPSYQNISTICEDTSNLSKCSVLRIGNRTDVNGRVSRSSTGLNTEPRKKKKKEVAIDPATLRRSQRLINKNNSIILPEPVEKPNTCCRRRSIPVPNPNRGQNTRIIEGPVQKTINPNRCRQNIWNPQRIRACKTKSKRRQTKPARLAAAAARQARNDIQESNE